MDYCCILLFFVIFAPVRAVYYNLRGNPRKAARNTTRYQQHGQIPEHRERPQHCRSRKQLSDIMKHSADYADKPNQISFQNTLQQQHSRHAQRSARKTENQRCHIAAEKAAQKHSHHHQQASLVRLKAVNSEQREDIRKPQLYARNRHGRWQLKLNHKHDKRRRSKHRKLRQSLYRNAIAPLPLIYILLYHILVNFARYLRAVKNNLRICKNNRNQKKMGLIL